MKKTRTTHFGYQEVPLEEKVNKVRSVFDSVASRYDLMNDLMSLGIHRLWKRATISASRVRTGHRVLDLAGGTGDLSFAFADRTGKEGEVILCDINASMLQQGRDRLINGGYLGLIHTVLANAEQLPFPDNYFDCICIAFGLRNVTDKDAALREMARCLKPGGQCMVLEFSHPTSPMLQSIYDIYSFSVLPFLGRVIADDEDSYRYLAESIRMHPTQPILKDMMLKAGFDQCEYQNFSGGITALHTATKY